MSNLIKIYVKPLSFHNHDDSGCHIVVNKNNILAVLPWSCASDIDEDICSGFNSYLLLVQGYFNHHLGIYNVEKYGITKEQFYKIYGEI